MLGRRGAWSIGPSIDNSQVILLNYLWAILNKIITISAMRISSSNKFQGFFLSTIHSYRPSHFCSSLSWYNLCINKRKNIVKSSTKSSYSCSVCVCVSRDADVARSSIKSVGLIALKMRVNGASLMSRNSFPFPHHLPSVALTNLLFNIF